MRRKEQKVGRFLQKSGFIRKKYRQVDCPVDELTMPVQPRPTRGSPQCWQELMNLRRRGQQGFQDFMIIYYF